ncbi:MAG: helix-turn-helix domain-containing protein [Magnetococcales bacterium]|nr:helix-turn-helix domain-containing protein [Magnetococcales bacterium]
MKDDLFNDLLESVRQMGDHMRGVEVEGVKVTERPEVEAKAVREAVGVSQGEFARLLGVSVRTLQNWEPHRTRPTGPARALLRMISQDPVVALRLLTT